MRPLRGGSLLAFTVALPFLLVACDQGPGSDGGYLAADLLVGLPFSEAESLVSMDAVFVVQDASPRVGLDPSFVSDETFSSRWLIVAACSDLPGLAQSTVIEVAVVPIDTVMGLSVGSTVEFSDAVSCQF